MKLTKDLYINTLGTFGKGTEVEVLSVSRGQAHVRVDNKEFYINTNLIE